MATVASNPAFTFVPRMAIELPLALPEPRGFDKSDPGTWPDIPGRLEYVKGRLLYMPPCGDEQQRTAGDVISLLYAWKERHQEFVVGGNEAGMLLGGEVRAADAVVWRGRDLGSPTKKFPRIPPVLAVDVLGEDDTLRKFAKKAVWYLRRGVEVVWLLDPSTRSAHVITREGTRVIESGRLLPRHPALPGLAPRVDDLFRQLGPAPRRRRKTPAR